MAYKKRLTTNAKIKENAQGTAIEAHAGFVRFIVSEVKKQGIKNVLELKKDCELWWLNKAFTRVLDFAEQVQLKEIATKLEGPGDEGEFLVKVEITDENKSPQESRNRIGEYFEV